MLEKIAYFALLKDFYGPLLTRKQQEILNLYYDNDLSLSEIAANMDASRQAIFDILKKAERALQEYESKLGLVERFQKNQERLQEAQFLLNRLEPDPEIHRRIKQILEELIDLR